MKGFVKTQIVKDPAALITIQNIVEISEDYINISQKK